MEQTDRLWGWGGIVQKEVKGLAKEHICTTHRHRPQCGDGQREVGAGRGGGGQRGGGEMGTSVIVSTIKIKFKKKKA